MGGAEDVLAQLVELYPDAPVYTSMYAPDLMPDCLPRLGHSHACGWTVCPAFTAITSAICRCTRWRWQGSICPVMMWC